MEFNKKKVRFCYFLRDLEKEFFVAGFCHGQNHFPSHCTKYTGNTNYPVSLEEIFLTDLEIHFRH